MRTTVGKNTIILHPEDGIEGGAPSPALPLPLEEAERLLASLEESINVLREQQGSSRQVPRMELHNTLIALGRTAADARGVRFTGKIMGNEGIVSDLLACTEAMKRERSRAPSSLQGLKDRLAKRGG